MATETAVDVAANLDLSAKLADMQKQMDAANARAVVAENSANNEFAARAEATSESVFSSLFAVNKVIPAEKVPFVKLMKIIMADDRSHPITGECRKDLLTAVFEGRKPHNLTGDAGGSSAPPPTGTKLPQDPNVKTDEENASLTSELLSYTPEGRAILAERAASAKK